jgi:hypothetical protein
VSSTGPQPSPAAAAAADVTRSRGAAPAAADSRSSSNNRGTHGVRMGPEGLVRGGSEAASDRSEELTRKVSFAAADEVVG